MKWTAELTRRKAQEYLDKWQPRLGLADMHVTIDVLLPQDMPDSRGDAALSCRDDSADATILINRYWWKEDEPRLAKPDLELNVLHELCHLTARELTHFVYRHRGTSENDKAWFRDAEERFADRTAWGLLRADRGGQRVK